MLSFILAAVVASGAAALPPPVTAPAQVATADPVTCHSEPIQGSRITHRVCLRASEAAQLRRDARWLLDHAQNGSQAPNMATMVTMGPMR